MTSPDRYVERGCARNATVLALGLVLPGALLVATVVSALTVPAAASVFGALFVLGSVGGRGRSRVAPSMQAWATLSADWPEVRSVSVVSDPAGVTALRRDLAATGRTATIRPSGWLNPVAPRNGRGFVVGRLLPLGTRAAVVIELEAGPAASVRSPQFRHPRGQGLVSTSTWVYPTRHPERLRSALAGLVTGG